MNIKTQDTLDFLAEFLGQTDTREQKWKMFQEKCDNFIEAQLLPSQFPGKSKVRNAFWGILRRMHILDVFPELAGKKVICSVGFPVPLRRGQHHLIRGVPIISLQTTSPRVFNAAGLGMAMPAQMLDILHSLSGKNDAIGNLFSAVVVQNGKLPSFTAFIALGEGCLPDTTFFKEFLEVADEIILAPEDSELRKATLSYLQSHRREIPVWIGRADERLFYIEKGSGPALRLRKGNPEPAYEPAPFTSFSFLFQWALQPVMSWLDQQKKELSDMEKLLTQDLVMLNSATLEDVIKAARGDIQEKIRNLNEFENECQAFRRGLLRASGELDSEFSSRVERYCPSIDDWSRAEELLLQLSVPNGRQRPEFRQLIDSLRKGIYPYPAILEAAESSGISGGAFRCEEIANIDRPIAHRLCIRLRHELGISDEEAGRVHASAIDCESGDEWYVHGISLMKTDVREAEACLRKTLTLGKRDAGKLLYENFSKERNYRNNEKTANFLLNALVPEMCFEKAMDKKRQFLPNKLFLLYISAAQGYVPAIREVAKLESRRANNESCSNKEQIMHRKQAIALYEFLQVRIALTSMEYSWLGLLYYADKRFKDAIYSFKKSSEAISSRYIGRMYHYGDGVEINLNEAKIYYRIAIRKGDQKAKDLLDKIEVMETHNHSKTRINTQGDYREQRSSTTHSSSSGGCFLTTASCRVMGYGDDCEVLQAYRNYRDTILANDIDGPDIITQYYKITPEILRRIDRLPDPMAVYTKMWNEYLLPGYQLLSENKYDDAKKLYIDLVTRLMDEYHVK